MKILNNFMQISSLQIKYMYTYQVKKKINLPNALTNCIIALYIIK
jgi:hypothetical protein